MTQSASSSKFSGIAAGAHCISTVGSKIMVLGHVATLVVLLLKAKRVDMLSSASLHAYYMSIWRLFYFEYFLLAFFAVP